MPIDAESADLLLDGALAPDDAPPGYAAVALVLRAADAPVRPAELEPEPDAVRKIFEEARRGPRPAIGSTAAEDRRSMRTWSVRAAVVGAIAALTLGGGVAMAATGSLPGPIQDVAGHIGDAVGISVPGGAPDRPAPTDSPADPDAPGGAVTSTSLPVTAPPEGNPGLGPETCAVASDGVCRAGEPHPSETRPAHPETTDPAPKDNPSVTRPSVESPPSVVPTHPEHPEHPDTPAEQPTTTELTTEPTAPPVTKDNPSVTRPGKP